MSKPRGGEGWSRATLWGSAILVAALVLAALFVIVTGDGDGAEPDPQPTPTESASPSETDNALPEGFVTLPAPTKTTGGYPTGYPQTPEGAAALTLVWLRSSGSALDYDQASTLVGAYMSGAPENKQELADALVTVNRQKMGVPLTGPPSAGVSAAVTFAGVNWETIEASEPRHVTVLAAMKITYTLPDGSTDSWTGSAALPAVWAGGRWWIDGATDTAGTAVPKYAEPGTAAFAAEGWKVIRNDDWAGALL